MSNRFFSLCLTVLLLSNIFFLNYIKNSTGFLPSDYILGIVLNQSTHILLFFYIFLNKNIPFSDSKTLLVLFIILLDFSNEIINYYYRDNIYSPVIDSTIVAFERISWTLIFWISGSSLFSKSYLKNICNIGFGIFMFYIFFEGFLSVNAYSLLTFSIISVIFIMVIMGSNTDEKYFHQIGIGALFIALGDLAFLYSGFHQDFLYKYLYTIPRILISLGELLIVYKVFEKFKESSVANNLLSD